ncbi:MAG: hypothetical protein ACKOYM_05045, partial [Actinomycetes bacterium]
GKDGPEPLSHSQADQLAEVRVRNHDGGVAESRVSTVNAPGQGGMTLVGQTDWAKGTGHVRVFPARPNGVVDAFWDQTSVWEFRPDLAAQLGGSPDAIVYVRRPRDSARRRLDQVLDVVDGLSATTPDNARIIRATPGSAFLRSDSIGGKQVEVLRFGERSIYWMQSSGLMARFEGSNERGNQPVVVDVAKRDEGSKVDLPPRWVPVERVADQYQQMAPSSP